jgi:hypothetical protein
MLKELDFAKRSPNDSWFGLKAEDVTEGTQRFVSCPGRDSRSSEGN